MIDIRQKSGKEQEDPRRKAYVTELSQRKVDLSPLRESINS